MTARCCLTPALVIISFTCSDEMPQTFRLSLSRVDEIVPEYMGRVCHHSRLPTLLVQSHTRMFLSGDFHDSAQFTHHNPIQRHKHR